MPTISSDFTLYPGEFHKYSIYNLEYCSISKFYGGDVLNLPTNISTSLCIDLQSFQKYMYKRNIALSQALYSYNESNNIKKLTIFTIILKDTQKTHKFTHTLLYNI